MAIVGGTALLALTAGTGARRAPGPVDLDSLSRRVDPYVARQRVLVLTDIANEPDDQMSMVRFLLYSNEFDVEGLVASTSTWMRNRVRPDVILTVIDAYERVRPSLTRHAEGYPEADALRKVVVSGQPGYGMEAVGTDRMSAGAARILEAAARSDPRPLWIPVWGGANTLAQALLHARDTMPAEALDALVAKLRVYSISDQDDAGPWIRREFPGLFYIVMPSPPNGEQYAYATWTGISGDRFYRNAPGADFTTFTDDWVNAHVRSVGPLGALYPHPCCIHEGDTPSFLGLIDNGLASAMSPTFGGWGGRYVWRQFYGETHPGWTQGGDSFPGNDSSRDTVVGTDGHTYTSDQATIWRWREAFQDDFAARMAWTVSDRAHANHNPVVVVNGERGGAPVSVDAMVGKTVTLDAAGTSDPDGDALRYEWFFYPEAGSGIPSLPVVAGGLRAAFQPAFAPGAAAGQAREGGIPPSPGGLPVPTPRVIVRAPEAPKTDVLPQVAGTAHVILAVHDAGSPSLTSYRRVILRIAPHDVRE